MTRYDFVLFAAQSQDFIEKLRELGLVDVTTTGWEPSEDDRQLLLDIEAHTKAEDCIRLLRSDEYFDAQAQPFASGEQAFARYVAVQQQASTINGELARLQKAADELRPWGPFDLEHTNSLAAQGVVVRYFFAPTSNFDKAVDQWSEQYTISVISRLQSYVYFVVVASLGDEVAIDAQEMKTPTMDIREAERQIELNNKQLRALDSEFSRLVASESLLKHNAALLGERLQSLRVEATAQRAADGELVIMEGWAEKSTCPKVDALLEAYPNVVYLKVDPTPEDDTPVKLKNHWFSKVFELVGDMYARPKYGTMDLTPFFAPFYMLFFGICLNDAGYGAILVLLGLWMLRKNPAAGLMRQASWFATLCGVTTVLFGGFCGSAFGVSLKEFFPNVPFFDFQNSFFSVALIIGIVQILFGMVLKIIMLSATLGFRYALAPLGWFLVVLSGSLAVGLPMVAPDWAIPHFVDSSPAFYAVLGIGAVLMFFFNSPGKNPFLNLGLGIWDTYNNITGILSDVLSYIRLFAIGLSGGILASVFNSLAAGFVPEDSNILVRIAIMLPILLIGHGINLFMSCISSFVHPMRLTFVEFYKNAGFEMSMRSFDPLRKLTETNNKQ